MMFLSQLKQVLEQIMQKPPEPVRTGDTVRIWKRSPCLDDLNTRTVPVSY